MSIPALNWCIEQKTLPPGEWVVLFHLCHAHNQEHGCFPSQDFLAEQTNMSKRSIVRHIGALEAAGLVVRQRRFNSVGERISDRYIMPFEPGFVRENPPSANLASGQSVHGYVPNGAQNVHEMAPKHEVTGIEHKEPLVVPQDKKPRRRPEVPLPPDWVPSEKNLSDAAERQFSAMETEHEADRFRNHHTAKGSLFRDWDAAWRTWLGNARKFSGGRMAFQASPGRHGQGSSIASIVARRRIDGTV